MRRAAPHRAPSLGRRLSAWLALQGLLAAAAVSLVVYAANLWILHSRQDEELQLRGDGVQHVLAETAAERADRAELRHRLDDLLAGRDDMALAVIAASGETLYRSPASGPGSANHLKTADWAATWPEGEPVQVRLSLDVSRDAALLRQLGVLLLAGSLAGSAVVAFTGYLLVRRGLAPVRALSAQIESMGLDQHTLRLDGSGQPSELQPLVARFNALLARVERAYEQLDGFNADVAHELRTPLTTLIGASELALRRDRPPEELREVIAANLEDLRRLAAIVNDMLFLSHADRGAVARRAPVHSLAAALGDVLEYHDAAMQERGLRPVVHGDCAGAFDIGLLRRALSNLLSNATRYATPGSEIRVSIEAGLGRVRLLATNAGAAIDELHLPRLFDRFYRAEPSRAQGADAHHGLGLAIVAAIARMHGGAPVAASDGQSTTIGLEIPMGDAA